MMVKRKRQEARPFPRVSTAAHTPALLEEIFMTDRLRKRLKEQKGFTLCWATPPLGTPASPCPGTDGHPKTLTPP